MLIAASFKCWRQAGESVQCWQAAVPLPKWKHCCCNLGSSIRAFQLQTMKQAEFINVCRRRQSPVEERIFCIIAARSCNQLRLLRLWWKKQRTEERQRCWLRFCCACWLVPLSPKRNAVSSTHVLSSKFSSFFLTRTIKISWLVGILINARFVIDGTRKSGAKGSCTVHRRGGPEGKSNGGG